jgi:uncharacterized membrane protein
MSLTVSAGPEPDEHAPAQRPEGRIGRGLGWAVVAAAAAAAVILPLAGASGSSQMISLLATVLGVVQGTRRYGWRVLLAFFAICYVVSNFWENLSVLTGFPFGNYYYTLTPQLFNVPVLIGVFYFGIGWVSWMTANTILDRADDRLDLRTRAGRVNVLALPVLAGATMTMFDFGFDSLAATVRNLWIWEDGGGVFGVPYTNYLGWWFVTWSFFQIFALVLAVRRTRRTEGATEVLPQVSHLQPVLVYLMFAVCSITMFIGFDGAESVVDATGVAWDTAALVETLMIMNIFSVLPTALFAIVKIARGDLGRA